MILAIKEFDTKIVRYYNVLTAVGVCCKNCKVFESVDRSKVFVVRILWCLNELRAAGCLW